MNLIYQSANSSAKMAGFWVTRSPRTGILPFILPKWQEAQIASVWSNASRHIGAINPYKMQ